MPKRKNSRKRVINCPKKRTFKQAFGKSIKEILKPEKKHNKKEIQK